MGLLYRIKFMLSPRFSPARISVHVTPGATSRRSTNLTAPVEAQVTASLRGATEFVQIEGIETTRVYRRPATQMEIDELPPHLREEARRHGIEESLQWFSTGAAPVSVEKNDTVRIQLQFVPN